MISSLKFQSTKKSRRRVVYPVLNPIGSQVHWVCSESCCKGTLSPEALCEAEADFVIDNFHGAQMRLR